MAANYAAPEIFLLICLPPLFPESRRFSLFLFFIFNNPLFEAAGADVSSDGDIKLPPSSSPSSSSFISST